VLRQLLFDGDVANASIEALVSKDNTSSKFEKELSIGTNYCPVGLTRLINSLSDIFFSHSVQNPGRSKRFSGARFSRLISLS